MFSIRFLDHSVQGKFKGTARRDRVPVHIIRHAIDIPFSGPSMYHMDYLWMNRWAQGGVQYADSSF